MLRWWWWVDVSLVVVFSCSFSLFLGFDGLVISGFGRAFLSSLVVGVLVGSANDLLVGNLCFLFVSSCNSIVCH
jgi:hypothetical protein